jgi:hypothetical protein
MNFRRLISAIMLILVSALFCSCPSRKASNPAYTAQIMKAMKAMRAGDWVLYYVNKRLQVFMQVLKKDSEGVSIEYATYFDRAPRQTSTIMRFNFEEVKHNLDSGNGIFGRTPSLEMTSSIEPIPIKERNITIESTHWTITTRNAAIDQWFSEEIPLWGIIRQRRNNDYTLVIRSWGRAGERIIWPDDIAPIANVATNK